MSAPYQAAFEAVADALPGNGSWRRAAMQGLTFPGRRDEAWRFTSAARLLATEHAPVEGSVELEGAVPLLEGPRDAVAKLGRAAGTEGFQGFTLVGDTVTLQLRGGCKNDGGTLTIYDHIKRTMAGFPEIQHVKVLGPDGTTQDLEGKGDSRPACLEP
ncbi:MAG: hypothetical protein KC656_11705 [Myxococcales bacterium]|nr:hypothetical protein [Myxococcales bacterium]